MRRTVNRLGQYYVALAQQVLGMLRTAGFVFPVVFEGFARTIDKYATFVGDDPSPLGAVDADRRAKSRRWLDGRDATC